MSQTTAKPKPIKRTVAPSSLDSLLPSKEDPTLQQSREVLARVLASEDIRVNHSSRADTAYFLPKERVLVLPMWDGLSHDDYIAMVAHEVAHALWTPPTCFDDLKAILARHGRDPKDEKEFSRLRWCWNVVEDVRIERLVKNRYQGLRRAFHSLYSGVFLEKFNEVEERYAAKGIPLSPAYRLNKHFKSGAFIDPIPFSPDELSLARRIASATGHQEVLRLSEELWLLEEQHHHENQTEEEEVQTLISIGYGSFLRNTESTEEQLYVEIPDYAGIVSAATVEAVLSKGFHEATQSAYGEFITANREQIQLLWSEFHRRAAAATLARERTSDTGCIDPTKLWSYRTTEDIFLTHTEVHRGVDHGIVLFLDWSGSMQSTIHSTAIECMCLVEFLRRSQIPATVYAFSDRWEMRTKTAWVKPKQDISNFSLLELVDTRFPERVYRRCASTLLGLTKRLSSGGMSVPRNLDLGGTPLNGCVLAAMSVVPRFREETGAKVVHTIFLTDGGATDWYYKEHDLVKNLPDLPKKVTAETTDETKDADATVPPPPVQRPTVLLRRKGFCRIARTEQSTLAPLMLLRDVCKDSRVININLTEHVRCGLYDLRHNYNGFDAQFDISTSGKKSVRLISLITEMIAAKKDTNHPIVG